MDLEKTYWKNKLITIITFATSLYNRMALRTLSVLSSFYRFTYKSTRTTYVICVCAMVHHILCIQNEFKNVAAQPTGWEVGGGPPGAANRNLTGFF